MHLATHFVHVDALVQFNHDGGVRMVAGWGDAVGVGLVDAHTVMVSEVFHHLLDDFIGRAAFIFIEPDVDIDVWRHLAGKRMAIDEQGVPSDAPPQHVPVLGVEQVGILAQGIILLAVTILEVRVEDALPDVLHRVIHEPFRITKEPAHGEDDAGHPFCILPGRTEQCVGVEVCSFLHVLGDVPLPGVHRDDGARMWNVEYDMIELHFSS